MKHLLTGVLLLLTITISGQALDVDFDCKSGILTVQDCEGSTATAYVGCLIEGGCTECEDSGIGGCEKCLEDIYVNNNQICFIYKGVAEPDCHNLDNTDLDEQYVDMFRILGDKLYISISKDGREPSFVDLKPLQDNILNQVTELIPDSDIETFSFDCDQNVATIKIGDQTRKMDLSCLAADLTNQSPQDLVMTMNCQTNVLTYSLTEDPTGGGQIDFSCLAETLIDTDDQNITDFSINGKTLQITIEDGNTRTVDLSDLVNEGSDDQKITNFSLNGSVLKITIEDGNTRTVDLKSIIPDSYLITDFYLQGNTLIIKQEGGVEKSVDLEAYLGTDSDDQGITQFSLSGTILTIAIEDGGSKTVNLSSIAGCCVDDQIITDFSLSGTTLSITIEDGNTVTLDIGSITTSYVYNVTADSGSPQSIENNETLQIRGESLIQTNTEADRVNVGIEPGNNSQLMVTNGGNPSWYSVPPCISAATGFLCWEDCGDGKKTVYIKG